METPAPVDPVEVKVEKKEEDKLNIARRQLNTVLAEKAPVYFAHMKHWFQMKSSKEKFDTEARKLLNPVQVQFHNDFLLALLNKVGGLAETSVSVAHERAFSYGQRLRMVRPDPLLEAEASDMDPDEMPRFNPVDLIEYLRPKSPQGAGCDGVKYAAQEIFLPDQALIIGRFMLAAWDHDLEGVEDDAANIMVEATQVLLKNILTAVISEQKAYKTRGHMKYDLGADEPNMWLRNKARVVEMGERGGVPVGMLDSMGMRRPPFIDEAEQVAAMELACSVRKEQEVITLTIKDVYQALQNNRNIIGSHTVYAVNMERMANMLNHPTKD